MSEPGRTPDAAPIASRRVTLRFFASIREAIGHGEEAWQTDALTVAQLRDELLARGEPYARVLARDRAVRMALDQVVCTESSLLPAGAEVAFFPPVTGG